MVSINQECFPSELSTCCPLGTTDGVRWGPLSSRFSRVRPPPANSHPPSRQPCLGVVLPAFAVFSGFLSFTHTHAHTRFHQLLQTPALQQKLYVMTELVVHHRRACSGCGPLRGQGQSHGPGWPSACLLSPPPRPAPLPSSIRFTRSSSFRGLRLLLSISPSHPKSPQLRPGQFCVRGLWTQPWRPIPSILRRSRTAGVLSGCPAPDSRSSPPCLSAVSTHPARAGPQVPGPVPAPAGQRTT